MVWQSLYEIVITIFDLQLEMWMEVDVDLHWIGILVEPLVDD